MTTGRDVNQVPLTTLSLEHFTAVKRAIFNIMATSSAVETFSQVVNGLPVPRSWNKWWLEDNPNPSPSQEASTEYAQNVSGPV
ncbi:hypothetical protein NUU61_005990 [Penicillium alfredii]|uniref:Uncharacterized protein n=1 Tax=Penicillium alfredii TaxID=1506179 RepID=A0A9W9F077_9EURO|nr:uncharacterized protein NUU61_005990 [Penicillium alfredii]KAJ5091120.1 hypothetical protein NUU61_005990 [Penicillium alfredii]